MELDPHPDVSTPDPGDEVTETDDDDFASIEQTQAALRDSIEQAKALALESERLIRAKREEPRAEPPNPA